MRFEHWIAGSWRAPARATYAPVCDPRTRTATDEVAAGDATDVDCAVRSAANVQRDWARRSAADRAATLVSVADGIEAHITELIDLERRCTGKIEAQARSEVANSVAYFRYFAGVLRAVHGRTIDLGGDSHAYTRLEPFGVVAVIAPWNYPINQASRAIAPGLAAGNAIVVKPSEFTSTSTLRLAEIAVDAGLPAGLLNVVTGTGVEVGQPLVTHPLVRKVAFTGSVETGKRIARAAAERVIPSTLELGGKSPLIAFDGADLERVAAAGVRALITNAGQVCAATTRLLLHEPVHDEVVTRIADEVTHLEPNRDFGPIITEAQYAKVLATLAEAQRSGLRPVFGGAGYDDGPGAAGWFIRPTLFERVEPNGSLAQEEIFGPVLVTMTFEDEATALDLANATDYGLVASIWTTDVAQGLRLAHRIDAGQVSINGGPLGIETPFGGYKASGYGREKGLEGLEDYTQVKTISLSLRDR